MGIVDCQCSGQHSEKQLSNALGEHVVRQVGIARNSA
jgi:hypothetical protein